MAYLPNLLALGVIIAFALIGLIFSIICSIREDARRQRLAFLRFREQMEVVGWERSENSFTADIRVDLSKCDPKEIRAMMEKVQNEQGKH